MKDLVRWISGIESLAYSLYRDASAYFHDDQPFSAFLDHMAQDEAVHVRLMERAAQALDNGNGGKPLVAPDSNTRNLIELPLQRNKALLTKGSLTRESLIDCMVATEFSEWNDIFLYVIKTLKEIDSEFVAAAPLVQHHMRHLEQFLESTPYGRDKLTSLRRLPPVWNEQILVVEDNRIMAELLEALLAREGRVAIANNGKEALRKVSETYYRVIISDIDMPVMDGLRFFEEAIRIHPEIKNRFIFMTGDLSPERREFFEKNRVRHLGKPFTVPEIRREVHEVMELTLSS